MNELISIFEDWNPWWINTKFSKNNNYKPRAEYKLAVDSIKLKEITILTGIRRAGKSTLMYQMVRDLISKRVLPEQIFFINFDDERLVDVSIDKIYDTYRSNLNPSKKSYIFLDEIQKKEGWEKWLKRKYDQNTNDKFVVSGSGSYLLERDYATLLTGRNLTFRIYPLSFKEYLEFSGLEIDKKKLKQGLIADRHKVRKLFNAYFVEGGFPEVFLKNSDFKHILLDQYFDDILYKDIIQKHNLNSSKTKDFVLYLMNNFTGLISYRNIRGGIGLSYDLIKDYISYCGEAFLFFYLNHFSYSYKEQKTLPSKVYVIDNGLRNSVSFKFSKDEGKNAENLVFLELSKLRAEIFYWQSKHEIDFVVKRNDGSIDLVNVCYSDDLPEREFLGFREFEDEFSNAKINYRLLITKDIEKEEDGIKYIPLWKWLLIGFD